MNGVIVTHFVVDASVVLKWFLVEEGSVAARAIFDGDDVLLAPSFVCLEVHHSLMFGLRGGRCPSEVAHGALAILPKLVARLVPSDSLLDEAARMSWTVDHAIYDCLYIALAKAEDAILLTSDKKQFAAARKLRVSAKML